MPIEIERKFLVRDDRWREGASGERYCQGYLCISADATVRIRLAGRVGYITVKGSTEGMSRAEFEYEIPGPDAEAMLRDHCAKPLIEKERFTLDYQGKTWTVDVFAAANQGLVVAEVELEHAQEQVPLPPWVGEEVTDDPRYRNSALVSAPMNGEEAPPRGGGCCGSGT
ncbi:CYTH domain-containing protein [Aquabacter sediminis]|uniref:CYTH domain-containing protein n=1 Tax=Aquabacter sediminis TaxID=3029197 RepID=UPI00237DA650|nr:CYTH domain-containing protein [Aquabacter sp. P-9]MDE1567909.1 CYTH domain-containing protein [Aquabacter sp. P-9]